MHCNVNAQCNVNIAMYGNVNKNVITKKSNALYGNIDSFSLAPVSQE